MNFLFKITTIIVTIQGEKKDLYLPKIKRELAKRTFSFMYSLKHEQQCFIGVLKNEVIAECFRPDKTRPASVFEQLQKRTKRRLVQYFNS